VLEWAAESEDVEYIRLHNNEFLTDLELMLEQIDSCLSNQTSETTVAEVLDLGKLKTGLIRMSDALSEMDRGEMNKALSNLQESAPTEDYAASVRVIANQIVLAEYEEAEVMVASLLSGL